MAITGFSHYNLRAERALLDRLRDFYVGVVGLTVGPRPPFGSYGYWLFAGEQEVLHLSEALPGEAARAIQVNGTFDHVAFNCTGLTETEAQLRALAIPFRRVDVTLTRRVQLFFRDPAGNGVELNFAA